MYKIQSAFRTCRGIYTGGGGRDSGRGKERKGRGYREGPREERDGYPGGKRLVAKS